MSKPVNKLLNYCTLEICLDSSVQGTDPNILLVVQAYLGFQQVNPNTYGEHRLCKPQEMVPSTLRKN